MSGSEQLARFKRGEHLTADQLLAAYVYAVATNDPDEARLDEEERLQRTAEVFSR